MQQVLANGPDFMLLTWPTSEKEFNEKPFVTIRIPNKTVVEPGLKLQASKTKETGKFVYYVIQEVVNVKESLTAHNQNIITARVDRLVE